MLSAELAEVSLLTERLVHRALGTGLGVPVSVDAAALAGFLPTVHSRNWHRSVRAAIPSGTGGVPGGKDRISFADGGMDPRREPDDRRVACERMGVPSRDRHAPFRYVCRTTAPNSTLHEHNDSSIGCFHSRMFLGYDPFETYCLPVIDHRSSHNIFYA